MKVLIGPSGGGKSTLLQCMNYLIAPDRGEIDLEGRARTRAKPGNSASFGNRWA